MVVPTSYTNTTFADYLKDEVLIDTAEELGWLDLEVDINSLMEYDVRAIEAASAVYTGATTINRLYGDRYVTIVGTGGTGTVTRDITTDYFVPAGTKMTFTAANSWTEGQNIFTTATDTAIGASQITFTAVNGSAADQRGWFYVSPLRGTINPIYEIITNATLMLLAKSDITEVTGYEDIKKLRLFGRREAWRVAMQTLASDYDYAATGGDFVDRQSVYQQCKAVFDYENSKVSETYGIAYGDVMAQQGYISSSNSKIKVRW